MDAPAKVRDPSQARRTWLRHVGSAALGIAFVAAVEGATHLERELRAVQQRDVVPWPSWAIASLFLLLGAVMLVIVRMSPRMPWMPTAAAALLIYGILAVLPSSLANALPLWGQWAPSVYWGQSIKPLIAGLMTATAMWSWWQARRQAVEA